MITVVLVAVLLGMTAGMFALGAYARRHPASRGTGSAGSGLLGAAFDEVFHPAAHDAHAAFDEQQRLMVPAPSPDGDKGIADNRIRLRL